MNKQREHPTLRNREWSPGLPTTRGSRTWRWGDGSSLTLVYCCSDSCWFHRLHMEPTGLICVLTLYRLIGSWRTGIYVVELECLFKQGTKKKKNANVILLFYSEMFQGFRANSFLAFCTSKLMIRRQWDFVSYVIEGHRWATLVTRNLK